MINVLIEPYARLSKTLGTINFIQSEAHWNFFAHLL